MQRPPGALAQGIISRSLQEVGSGGTDLRSYPSHAFGAGPSHSRAMGGYAPGTHIPSGNGGCLPDSQRYWHYSQAAAYYNT